jgi:transposase-like protein
MTYLSLQLSAQEAFVPKNDSKHDALLRQGTLNPRSRDVRHPLFENSEFFDPRDLVQVKYEMLRQVQIDKAPVSESARAFGFSRPTFYQARLAFEEEGLSGLVPHKRGPRGAHKLTPPVMEFVVQIRAAEPSLPSEELARRVNQEFGLVVHGRSIERRLDREKKRR